MEYAELKLRKLWQAEEDSVKITRGFKSISILLVRRGADKSLALPGMKQATANELGI